MTDSQDNFRETAGSSRLNNMGGPQSRSRKEKINSSLFDQPGMTLSRELHYVNIPAGCSDIEEWLLSIARGLNWDGWNEALPRLQLPPCRQLVFPAGDMPSQDASSAAGLLRSAVILSRCSKSHYAPGSPMIFTRGRLERKIEIIRINLNGYYEMGFLLMEMQ